MCMSGGVFFLLFPCICAEAPLCSWGHPESAGDTSGKSGHCYQVTGQRRSHAEGIISRSTHLRCLIRAPLFLTCLVFDKRAPWVFFLSKLWDTDLVIKGQRKLFRWREGYISVWEGEVRGELLLEPLGKSPLPPDVHTRTHTCLHTYSHSLNDGEDGESWRQKRRNQSVSPLPLMILLSFHLEGPWQLKGTWVRTQI